MNGLRLDLEGLAVFAGAGPGADDLITVRDTRVVAEADIVIWASSLVHPGIVANHKLGAKVIGSASIPLGDLVPFYTRARDKELLVARVYTDDPDIYGATTEQRDLYTQISISTETIPGTSAFPTTVARVDSELTLPEVAQSMILTRLEGGRTPVPEKEAIGSFVTHGTTMSIYLSVARNKQPGATLLEGGYPPKTPCVISYRVTWPDKAVWRVRLKDLSATIKEHKLWKHTIVPVDPALATDRVTKYSHLYHPGFQHECRGADKAVVADLREHGTATYNLENGDNT